MPVFETHQEWLAWKAANDRREASRTPEGKARKAALNRRRARIAQRAYRRLAQAHPEEYAALFAEETRREEATQALDNEMTMS